MMSSVLFQNSKIPKFQNCKPPSTQNPTRKISMPPPKPEKLFRFYRIMFQIICLHGPKLIFNNAMSVVWLVCLAAHLSRDGYISAVPKRKQQVEYLKENSSLNMSDPVQRQAGVTMLYSEVMHRPRIRHKSLARGGTVDGENLASDNLASDNLANSDKEIIMVQALPIRSNRTKSNLDKLVREPELGR